MVKYAIVKDGKVINVAVSNAALADNWIPANGAGIGWAWDGGKFIAPAHEPKVDHDAKLIAAIKGATTLDELKAALVGGVDNARVRGGPK